MSIEFVYFNRDYNNLFGARADGGIALYRDFLRRNDIEESQYFNESIPNIFDIADDLLSEYADIICFLVEKDNVEFSVTVAQNIYDSEEDVQLVFVTKGALKYDFFPYIEVFDEKVACDELNKMLQIDKAFSMPESFKPYKTNLFPVKYVEKFGILLNRKMIFPGIVYDAKLEDVLEEIEYTSKHLQKDGVIVLNSYNIENYSCRHQLSDIVEKLELTQKVVMKEETLRNNTDVLINGLRYYLMGYYINNSQGEYTKHISVNQKELTPDLLKALSVHNSGNSAIYGIGEGKLCFDEVKSMSKEAGFLFTNYLELHSNDDKNFTVTINDEENAFAYDSIPYSEYSGSKNYDSYVTLKSRKDYEEFIDDFRRFVSTGVFDKIRMWKPFFREKCRFLGGAVCSLADLPKFFVANGKVYPCDGCSVDLGDVKQQHFQLIKKATVEKERKENSRKCFNCKERAYCGKCAMLPDYLSDEEYCGLMRNDTSIVSYMTITNIAKYICEYAKIGSQKFTDVRFIRFITRENLVAIPELVHGETEYFEMNVAFYKNEIDDSFISISLSDRKAFTMNQNMFILCELMYKGLSSCEIISFICKHYGANVEAAEAMLKNALKILGEKGYLKRDVYKNGLL